MLWQADKVERFVVVHGQIILNQFKNFPKKAVANSAFATALKGRMELRRHCKLYLAARPKIRVRGLRANPMRDRAHIRMKPMTATATTMVKAIWRSYFNRTGQLLAGVLCFPFLFAGRNQTMLNAVTPSLARQHATCSLLPCSYCHMILGAFNPRVLVGLGYWIKAPRKVPY